MKDETRKIEDLKSRTRDFALRIVRLYSNLLKKTETQIIGKQILSSGTSVGAHYREATRAKSNADFISKLEGGLQELEETQYWLELLIKSEMFPVQRLEPLYNETEELISIFVTMVKRVKEKRQS